MSRLLKTCTLLVILAAVITVFATPSLAEIKLGYIRSDWIFSQYKPYTDAQKQLESFHKAEVDVLEKDREALMKKYEDAQSKELLMTPEMKQAKAEELAKEEEALQKSYEALMTPETGKLAKKQIELLEPIINAINEVLMRVAKDEAYDFIFDATTGPQGNTILFANEKFDISEHILEELKKETAAE